MSNDTDSEPKTPGKAWLMGAIGWLVPGLGHLLQGKWGRALLLGGAVWVCFLGGLWMGGHLTVVTAIDFSSPMLVQLLPMIANLGAGALYGFCWFFGFGFADGSAQAARATYEYGNMFLLIAGLLNYLVMLDAFDISAGRKS